MKTSNNSIKSLTTMLYTLKDKFFVISNDCSLTNTEKGDILLRLASVIIDVTEELNYRGVYLPGQTKR